MFSKRSTKKHKISELIAFLDNGTILYPLKTPENQRFSGVFRGYKIGPLAKIGLSLNAKHESIALNNKRLNDFQCCNHVETR